MRKIVVLGVFLLSFVVNASQKAVTEEGDVVILHDNGSWTYEDKPVSGHQSIPLNPQVFKKPAEANFQLKSTKTDVAFGINTKKWNFNKNESGEAAEYNLKLKSGDLYAMAITEQLEIDIETLADIAVDNARDAAPDIQVIKKEYRMVNGLKVIYMEMEGTIQNVKFTYLGYYYSDASGSTQYLTYTGSNLVNKYRSDIDTLLNGLTLQ